MSRSIAAVAAGVLIGGGTPACWSIPRSGVINPFALGIIGIAAGVGASILMGR